MYRSIPHMQTTYMQGFIISHSSWAEQYGDHFFYLQNILANIFKIVERISEVIYHTYYPLDLFVICV